VDLAGHDRAFGADGLRESTPAIDVAAGNRLARHQEIRPE
jgi:hypothetical protein